MEAPPSPSHVVIAYDATKDRSEHELELTVHGLRMRGDILRPGDTLLVLAVLHKVPHPMGYTLKPCSESFFGATDRAIEEEVTKKVDQYVNMLLQSAEDCEDEGVCIEVKVTAGTPLRKVILQEVVGCKATWVVLDRHLRRDLRFYLKQIPSRVAWIQDSLIVQILRAQVTNETDPIDHKAFYSMSKPVPVLLSQGSANQEQSVISVGNYSLSIGSLESSDMHKSIIHQPMSSSKSREHTHLSDFANSHKQEKSDIRGDHEYSFASNNILKQQNKVIRQKSSEAPLLCAGCGARTELYIQDSMKFTFPQIQLATNDFAKENLLGEGGYGYVYKGELKDGQLIAAKVRKEASTQGFTEFHSEVHVLSFARHKNIVMLLGSCCKENLNILVYEYICNQSLYWHLFDTTAPGLDWHQRRAIALGTAKGLRFLHEECRGGPIIHRDMRPSNILLTHDYVPMLGDFGLARWKTNDDPVQTKILGTLGYLAPEYAENGIVSVRTDVYAFGIVLLQLMSGRKVIDAREGQEQSIRQWAEPIIETLALHELIDPRIGDLYDTYELYLMAKTAYLCVQRRPEMRPSMGEVVRLLEGDNDHLHHAGEQFIPHYTKL
ncbi:serine/threonine-protein kinase CDG1-like isoform X1 [Carica papaya]|uniref:serine/threonine-protein kinase CDG1-like isoform X1 n=2 Tax=Carica papaya TaxID=3649 RepID=UPI000B8C8250|nr:serine/threonine-protein kinase CDG1-like isoform X1 [Carica papaya]XP_021902602.1 serine/threonine-protein kinase CDG1-like isoform X1 [Carica papaya]